MSDSKHFLVLTYEGWGLCRPLVNLALQLLVLRNNHLITLLVPGGFTDKVAVEIKRFGLGEPQTSRLKVIHFAETEARRNGGRIYLEERVAILEALLKGIEPLLLPIMQGLPVWDTVIGTDQSTHSTKPHLIIADILLTFSETRPIARMVRSAEGALGLTRTPIVIWIPMSAAAVAWQFFSEVSPGPRLGQEVEERLQKGMTKGDAYREVILTNDLVVDIPRCGPMHVYEIEPNGSDHSLPPAYSVKDLDQVDGIAFNWPACMSQEALKIAQSRWNMACAISPFSPPPRPASSINVDKNPIDLFLDDKLAKHGERSVLYISFGTWNYPPSLAQTRTLLDVLRQVGRPYIFLPGVAPPESRVLIQEAVTASDGLGMTSDWASQLDILHHPATAAFLSHAGSNSVMESISASMPLVLWPGGIDQPMIANELSLEGVAVELLQIRRGEHVGRKTATGVLVTGKEEDLRAELLYVTTDVATSGPLVTRLRESMESLHNRLVKDGSPGGQSQECLVTLADYR